VEDIKVNTALAMVLIAFGVIATGSLTMSATVYAQLSPPSPQQQLSPEEIQNEILRGRIQIEGNDNDATTTESSIPFLSNDSVLVYESPVHTIRTQYPDRWEILIQSTSNSSLSLRFNSPLENDTDIFRENVLFVIDTISNNTILSNYTSAALTSYLEEDPDLKVNELSLTNLTNNSIPAYKLVASRTQDGLEFMQIFAINENELYTIIYSSEKTRYSTYLPIVEEMINSFEVT
jgi:PsbP-like protein